MNFPAVDLPGHEGRLGYYMVVSSGIHYFPCDPRIEEIDLADIAHHLAFQCRFGGACTRWLSVAEHSVLASYFEPDLDPREKLMHDAAEAYLQDMIRPLKYLPQFREPYLELERRNERLIAEKFGLEYPWPESVKRADEAMATLEMRDNIACEDKGKLHDPRRIPDFELQFWSPYEAEWAFRRRCEELGIRA
jgi:hypothetical protein